MRDGQESRGIGDGDKRQAQGGWSVRSVMHAKSFGGAITVQPAWWHLGFTSDDDEPRLTTKQCYALPCSWIEFNELFAEAEMSFVATRVTVSYSHLPLPTKTIV